MFPFTFYIQYWIYIQYLTRVSFSAVSRDWQHTATTRGLLTRSCCTHCLCEIEHESCVLTSRPRYSFKEAKIEWPLCQLVTFGAFYSQSRQSLLTKVSF